MGNNKKDQDVDILDFVKDYESTSKDAAQKDKITNKPVKPKDNDYKSKRMSITMDDEFEEFLKETTSNNSSQNEEIKVEGKIFDIKSNVEVPEIKVINIKEEKKRLAELEEDLYEEEHSLDNQEIHIEEKQKDAIPYSDKQKDVHIEDSTLQESAPTNEEFNNLFDEVLINKDVKEKENKIENDKNIKEYKGMKEEEVKDEIKNIIDMDVTEEKTSKSDFNHNDFMSIDEVEGGIDKIDESLLNKEPKEVIRPIKATAFIPPVTKELSKKEKKQLMKQQMKEDNKNKKEKDLKEKLKWTTYHNGFVLADGEKVIKEYNCLKLINPPGTGIISLTNKRLLCSTNELIETEIENITGIISKYKSKFSGKKILLFLFLGALSAACFMASMNIKIDLSNYWTTMPSWFKYVLYGVGGISGLVSLGNLFTVNKKEFHIQILMKAFAPLVAYSGITGKIKPRVVKVKPGKESKIIVHEIGAIILEIKAGKY